MKTYNQINDKHEVYLFKYLDRRLHGTLADDMTTIIDREDSNLEETNINIALMSNKKAARYKMIKNACELLKARKETTLRWDLEEVEHHV